jgi:hypothetical protein
MDKLPTERLRERPAQVDSKYVQEREAQGWRLCAVEWEREDANGSHRWTEDVPYGLRVSRDCTRLEENPTETEVLLALMELIVQDKRLSEAAVEMNRRGYKTRDGKLWGPGGLFDLLPRLIDVGPRIFRTDEWAHRRRALVKAV